ncbi:hypothetical protein MANES_05G149001v8 [Manihot esculenta]|uniref:Uncharacterized protein n=1 Tax=Manihot esculenta TaxID=3983 RepID=A0ACB7HPD8_MANES|nr:hypothetical protein MANES_05G149001v8 [Manihot esculenta]
MSLLIWNIQSDAAKRSLRVLKDYCHQYKPLILALVEPKVSGPQAKSISLGLDFNEWVQVEAIGLSGGIWVFWQSKLGTLTIAHTNLQFVHCVVTGASSPTWEFIAVYTSPREQYRNLFFSRMLELRKWVAHPWLLAGDFNTFLDEDETISSESYMSQRCQNFKDW